MLNINEFKIEITKRENAENNIVALVTIEYDTMRVKGFRIIKKIEAGTGEIVHWVAPPQYYNKIRKKYGTLFFMPKFLWKKLEERILAKYLTG